jgi:cytosine deaminase
MGAEDYLRGQGIQVEVVDDSECVALMRRFIDAQPELWQEDIGV